MHTTRSHKRSKSWTPKLLLGLGIFVILWLLFSVVAAYIIRANRGVITQEISRIQSLPSENQQAAYQRLVIATGHDQQASRALADYYKRPGDYHLAGETYLAAQPELRVEAAEAYTNAYDFQKASDLLGIKTNAAKGDDWQALAQQAHLNLNPKDLKACENISEKPRFDNVRTACAIITNPSVPAQDVYRLVSLGFPLVAMNLLESAKVKSATDYTLLSQIAARKGDKNLALKYINDGFAANPYDRTFLTEALRTLSMISKAETQDLRTKIQKNLDLLPAQ